MTITSYHAHVYYNEKTRHRAGLIRKQIESAFTVKMGRWRDQPVGPHPQAMYQVAFESNQFGELVPWLMLHRDGLDILVHPNTGSSHKDHTANAIWLGNKLALCLEALDDAKEAGR